jgi:hypothetical protein
MATFLLTWTLPALGLVAVSMRNGACHLQPTVEGAAWLQAALDQAHRLTGADDHVALELTVPRDALSRHGSRKASVEVTADDALSVIIPLDAPVVCSFHVVHLGDLLSPGPPARFRLTATTLHRAVEWGYSFADAVLTLSRHAGAPLPVEAVAILERWRAQVTTVSCLAGYRLDFREPETLNALRQRTPFRRRTTPLTTGQAVWVPQSETQGLFRYLRRLGYALQVPGGAEGEASGAPKGQGPPWASSTWLALARSYELLRQFFPGLAHLRTGDLRGFFL